MPSPLSLTLSATWEFTRSSSDLDPSSLRRELHGVAQQVPDHLLQAGRVASDLIVLAIEQRLHS